MMASPSATVIADKLEPPEIPDVPMDNDGSVCSSLLLTKGDVGSGNGNGFPNKAYLMDRILIENERLLAALKVLGIDVQLYNEEEQHWNNIDFINSILIFEEFSGPLFDIIRKRYHSRIYGPPILIETAERQEAKLPITKSRYPIYCSLLRNCKIGVTGVTSRDTLHSLHRYILYMDGIYMEKEAVVTHLLANKCTGSKYRAAVALGKPVLKIEWVHEVWNNRSNFKFDCNSLLEKFKLPVFHGLRVSFEGFDEPEKVKMMKLAEDNGATVLQSADSTVTHIVRGLSNRANEIGQSEEIQPLCLTPIRSIDVGLVNDRSMMNPSPVKRPRFEPLQVLNDLNEEDEDQLDVEMATTKAMILKSEWFWSSIQIEACADEEQYIADVPKSRSEDVVNCSIGTMSFSSPACPFSDPDTPKSEGILLSGGRRKRKRGQDFILGHSDSIDFSPITPSRDDSTTARLLNCSRAIDKPKEISDELFAECLKQINEFLANPDYKSMSARHREFAHLLETERNYVLILVNIVKNFKEPCENEDQPGGRILDVSEVREIFGDILPIYNLHRHLLYDLAQLQQEWTEESLIGKVYSDHESEFKKAYKQFINYFEDCKTAILRCEKEKPRFLAFIRIAQGRAECGKQSLSDLMIRPVQRLPSTALILDRLKKHTSENNPDYDWTAKALEVIQQANQNINEEKKRNEVLHAVYELDRKVDGLPPLIVSSHRQIEATLDVQSLTDTWGQKFESITLFAFNDKLMVVKRRHNAINKNLTGVASIGNTRSPAMGRKSIAGTSMATHSKPYKFLELIPYESIRRVIDIKDGISSFGFVVRDESGMRDRTIAFTTPEDPKWSNKSKLLELFVDLTTKSGQNERTLPVYMTQAELRPRSGENSSVLEKASKFASKTRHKVTRALSLNRTPSKLRRTVSQMMMSPFSSARSQPDPDSVSQTGSECSTTPLRANLSSISLWGWGSRRGLTDATPKSRRTMSAKESRKNIQPIEES